MRFPKILVFLIFAASWIFVLPANAKAGISGQPIVTAMVVRDERVASHPDWDLDFIDTLQSRLSLQTDAVSFIGPYLDMSTETDTESTPDFLKWSSNERASLLFVGRIYRTEKGATAVKYRLWSIDNRSELSSGTLLTGDGSLASLAEMASQKVMPFFLHPPVQHAVDQGKPAEIADMTKALAVALTMDARHWAVNHLDQGSLQPVVVVTKNADGSAYIRGTYYFNGGAANWVAGNYANGRVTCLRYWDTSDCAPVRQATITSEDLVEPEDSPRLVMAQADAEMQKSSNSAAKAAIKSRLSCAKCIAASTLYKRKQDGVVCSGNGDPNDCHKTYGDYYDGISYVNNCDFSVDLFIGESRVATITPNGSQYAVFGLRYDKVLVHWYKE